MSGKARERQRELLSAYLDGELPPDLARKLEKQLTREVGLRAELEELRQTVQLVRSIPTVPVPRSFTLDPAVYGRVRPRRMTWYPVLRFASAAVTLLFVILFAGDIVLNQFAFTAMAPAPAEYALDAQSFDTNQETDTEQRGVEIPKAAMDAVETGEGVIITREVEQEITVEKALVEEAAEESAVGILTAPPSENVEMEAAAEPGLPGGDERAGAAVAETPYGSEGDGETEAQEPSGGGGDGAVMAEMPSGGGGDGAVTAEMPSGGGGDGEVAAEMPREWAPLTIPSLGANEEGADLATTPMAKAPTPAPTATPGIIILNAPTLTPQPQVTEQPPLDVYPASEPSPLDDLQSGSWLMVARWAAGILAVVLIAVTMVARRFGW